MTDPLFKYDFIGISTTDHLSSYTRCNSIAVMTLEPTKKNSISLHSKEKSTLIMMNFEFSTTPLQ